MPPLTAQYESFIFHHFVHLKNSFSSRMESVLCSGQLCHVTENCCLELFGHNGMSYTVKSGAEDMECNGNYFHSVLINSHICCQSAQKMAQLRCESHFYFVFLIFKGNFNKTTAQPTNLARLFLSSQYFL